MEHPTGTRIRHRRGRRGLAATALLLSGALLASGCTSTSAADDKKPGGDGASDQSTPAARAYPGMPDTIAQQRLQWESCPEPSAAQGGGEAPGKLPDGTAWQCAELTVPLDYEAPDGETIEIALVRAVSPASEESRIGSLIFNFGGPGGSGVTGLPGLSEEFEALRDGYDLVSFDPRGVGDSAGVVCLDAAEVDALEQEMGAEPTTPAQEKAYEEAEERYIAACEANSGAVLPHLTTVNTARDMDLLRHVLGDNKLHYFGFSYGTQLGGVYAHLFPQNVGRAVLDAVVDPDADETEGFLQQIAGFQLALEHYMEDCAEEFEDNCATGAGGSEGNAILTDFLAGLAEEPLPTDDEDRDLTQSLAVTGIIAALYDEETWDYLTMALWSALEDEDGSMLLLFADFYNGRDENGQYSNQTDARTAISCADAAPVDEDAEEPEDRTEEFIAASPVFGPYAGSGQDEGCEGWPVAGDGVLDVSAEGAPPMVLIGTTGDPATPYEGAERMQNALGEGVGVLLTYEGEGHGAYGSDDCIDEAVDEYLLNGMVPEDGLVCG
jgi:pimeloyl-ACP methyl ester carboxylesterase